jgi:hypothetical protein
MSDWYDAMLDQAFLKATRLRGVARRASIAQRRGSGLFCGFRKIGRVFNRLIRITDEVRNMLRRMDERRRLTELSPLERRDLGPHEVRQELNKWPWQH